MRSIGDTVRGDECNEGVRDGGPSEELYDHAADSLEQMNAAGNPTHADELARLRSLVDNWMRATNDPLLHGPVHGKPDDEPGWGYPFPLPASPTIAR